MIKRLLSLLLILCCLVVIAADNNPRVYKLRGLKGLWMSPPVAYYPSNEATIFGWWQPEGLTNLTDGLKVDYWTDSSGHSLHMRTTNTTSSPISSNNIVNGFAGVWFNGDGKGLTNACEVEQTNVFFFVVRQKIYDDGTWAFMYLFDGVTNDIATSQSFYWQNGGSTNFLAHAGPGGTLALIGGPVPDVVCTYTIQYAGALGKVWTNGVLAVTNQCGLFGTDGGMTWGRNANANYPYWGYLLEAYCLTNTFAEQASTGPSGGTVLHNGSEYLRGKYRHY